MAIKAKEISIIDDPDFEEEELPPKPAHVNEAGKEMQFADFS